MGPKLSQCRINNSRVVVDKIGEMKKLCTEVFGEPEKWTSKLAEAFNVIYWLGMAEAFPDRGASTPYKEDDKDDDDDLEIY